MKKLKAIYVDDDPFMLQVISDLSKSSSLLEVIKTYTCPKNFLEDLPRLDCDVFLLDIIMDYGGFLVASKLEGRPFMFVTGAENVLKEGLALNPIDILTKPVTLERFNMAAEKLHHYYDFKTREKKYEIFHIAGTRTRVNVLLDDIMVVLTDKADCRNKELLLRNGKTYKITGHTLEHLLRIAPKLVQINIAELVSKDAIEDFSSDTVNLKGIIINGKKRTLSVNRSYKKSFSDFVIWS